MYGVFGMIVGASLALGSIYAHLARERTRSSIVFRHLGLIVQQNLPLSTALELAAQSESGKIRVILRRLADHVETGLSLSESLLLSYSACPALALSIVRSAEQTGTLPGALCELNRRMSETPTKLETEITQRWLAFAVVMVAFLLVYGTVVLGMPVSSCSGVSYALQDFGTPLPPLTQDVLDAATPLGTQPQTILGHVFRLTWAVLIWVAPICLFWTLARLRARRADRAGILSLIFDYVQWRVWFLRRIAEARGCANSVPIMRLALAAGWPLPEAIRRAAEVDANVFWQRQLKAWGRAILDGGDAIDEGRRLKLPETLLSYLAIGLRDGDPDAALYGAEDYYICMLQRRRKQLVQVVWPLATLYLGVLVCLFCMGVFQGTMAVVDHCCRQIG